MGSTFSTYGVAYSGMYVNQSALTATSNNIANLNTTGASKVKVDSAEQDVVNSDGTSTGVGVSITSINRCRDIYLDGTYRTQNSKSIYWSVKSGNLEYLDKILEEYETDSSTSASDTTTTTYGVEAEIDDFFSAWQTLSTDGDSESTRETAVSAGTDLISVLTGIDKQLQQLQADAVTGVKDGVDSLNDLSSQVAELNKQITQAEAGGGEASYLRDQRDSLLDQMSSLADIQVAESNGTQKVTLGGTTLVDGGKSHKLIVEGSGESNDPLIVKWEDSNTEAAIKSGSIKAYLEDADQRGYEIIDSDNIPYDFNSNATTSSISTMRQALNDLVTTIATKINSLSTSGVDLDGNPGLAFFTVIDDDKPLSITNIQVNLKTEKGCSLSDISLSITNIQVNPELVRDPDKVVTSSSGEAGDNTIANEICNLASDTSCYKSDGLSLDITDFYKSVISWIGTAGETSSNNYEKQEALVTTIDNQRKSVSSISIDEEMSNMIKFQTAYAASARVMSTIDNLIGDLINEF